LIKNVQASSFSIPETKAGCSDGYAQTFADWRPPGFAPHERFFETEANQGNGVPICIGIVAFAPFCSLSGSAKPIPQDFCRKGAQSGQPQPVPELPADHAFSAKAQNTDGSADKMAAQD
jgi:hypothetical protein